MEGHLQRYSECHLSLEKNEHFFVSFKDDPTEHFIAKDKNIPETLKCFHPNLRKLSFKVCENL
jgi:hypothetical protein